MKFSSSLFFAFILLLASCGKQSPSIHGEWKVEGDPKNKAYIFSTDGGLTVFENGIVVSSPAENIKMKYEIDETKKPHWMDFVMFNTGNNAEMARFKMIYEWVDEYHIKISSSSNPGMDVFTRPSEFGTQPGDTKILMRTEPR
jgi:hypothetical protein